MARTRSGSASHSTDDGGIGTATGTHSDQTPSFESPAMTLSGASAGESKLARGSNSSAIEDVPSRRVVVGPLPLGRIHIVEGVSPVVVCNFNRIAVDVLRAHYLGRLSVW